MEQLNIIEFEIIINAFAHKVNYIMIVTTYKW